MAGLPPIIEFLGKDFVTTAFEPITQFSPIVTPGNITTPSPTQTLSSIITSPFENNGLNLGGIEKLALSILP